MKMNFHHYLMISIVSCIAGICMFLNIKRNIDTYDALPSRANVHKSILLNEPIEGVRS